MRSLSSPHRSWQTLIRFELCRKIEATTTLFVISDSLHAVLSTYSDIQKAFAHGYITGMNWQCSIELH